MEILITGGALGAVLGRFFKVLILVPITALAIALLMLKCEFAGLTVAETLLGLGLLVTSLELGYLTGLLSGDLRGAARALGNFRFRQRAPGPVRPT